MRHLVRGSGIKMPGDRPLDRLKKTWKKCVEDQVTLSVNKEEALSRDSWTVIEYLT